MMMCICGHAEKDHSLTGRCRVTGCACDHFEPVPEIAAGEPVPELARAQQHSLVMPTSS